LRYLKRWKIVALIGLIVVGGAAIWTGAAPMVPATAPKPPEEIRSLAGIKVAQLVVEPFPAELGKVGGDVVAVRVKAKKRLEDAGITIIGAAGAPPEVPVLTVKTLVVTDPSMPDVMVMMFFMDAAQIVQVERINTQLKLPTCTLMAHGAARKDKVPQAVSDYTSLLIDRFIEAVQVATKG